MANVSILEHVFPSFLMHLFSSQMPVWAFVLALLIGEKFYLVYFVTGDLMYLSVLAFTYIIPIGMIQAITNQQIGLK